MRTPRSGRRCPVRRRGRRRNAPATRGTWPRGPVRSTVLRAGRTGSPRPGRRAGVLRAGRRRRCPRPARRRTARRAASAGCCASRVRPRDPPPPRTTRLMARLGSDSTSRQSRAWWRLARPASAAVVKPRQAVGNAASTRRPVGWSRCSSRRERVRSSTATTSSVASASSQAAGVSSTLPPCRSSSWEPVSRSSLAICWEMALSLIRCV